MGIVSVAEVGTSPPAVMSPVIKNAGTVAVAAGKYDLELVAKMQPPFFVSELLMWSPGNVFLIYLMFSGDRLPFGFLSWF